MIHFVYLTVIKPPVGRSKYYIGKHSTNDINDGYFGSGTLLKALIRKGFPAKRIILKMFDTSQDAYEYERKIITTELLFHPRCLNLKEGGNQQRKIQ